MTVTGRNAGKTDTDVTDRRGMFTLDVPAGNVDITARKAGYSFGTLSVSVQAGENRTGVSIAASGTLEPRNVVATRDRANSSTTFDGNEFDGNISIDWDAGAGPTTGVTYSVHACVPAGANLYDATDDNDCDATADHGSEGWATFGTPTTTATARLAAVTAPTNDDEGFYVRVVARPASGDSVMSERAMVAAIDVTPSNATVKRETDSDPDSAHLHVGCR